MGYKKGSFPRLGTRSWVLAVMPTFGVVALAIAALLTLEGGAERPKRAMLVPTPAEPIVAGGKLFEEQGCARCHRIWGKGDGDIGPDLGVRGSTWQDIMWFSGELWNHTPAMNQQMRELKVKRPVLSVHEVQELAAYLFYVKFIGPPGDTEKGRAVFERAQCIRCHQIAGRGGTVGPRLDDLRSYMSLYFLARTLWNHGPKMAEKMTEMGLIRHRLDGDDVRHLVAFLRGGGWPLGPMEMAYARAGTPRRGEALFRSKGCAGCHSFAGTGGKAGPDLQKSFRNLDLSGIVAAMWNHGPRMWAKMKEAGISFPELGDKDISDLVAYFAYVQYVGPRGDVSAGKRVFEQKSCSLCHPVAGKGPKVGPDLASSEATHSILHWTAAIWNHASAMEPKFRATRISWPQFEGSEMRDLVEYLHAQHTTK